MADPAIWESSLGNQNSRDTIIKFYDREVEIESKTTELGRPYYEKQIFILKITPGDTLMQIDREIRYGPSSRDPETGQSIPPKPDASVDARQFPGPWDAYKRKVSYVGDGTPLAAWPQISRGQVMEFKALNLHTVEHLANAPENVASKIIGFWELQRNAKNFLALAKDTVLLGKMEDMVKEKDEKLLSLESKMNEMMLKMESAKKPSKKKKKAVPTEELAENDIT